MTVHSAVSAALAAAARGWHVFPLRPNAKTPAFPNHTEVQCTGSDPWCRQGHVGWEARATVDPTRIRRGFAHRPYGVGIATGPSGLVVIDLDVAEPSKPAPSEWQLPGVVDGHDVLAVLCGRAGQPMPIDTHTVATPSGGTHLYYAHPPTGPTLRNTTGGSSASLGWLVDTRAHGGYVAAPGSHVAHRPYRLVHDVDPAPLPGWLAERLTPAPLPPQRPIRIDLPDDRAGRYLAAAIRRQLATIANAGEGGRNTALYRSAVALGQLAAGGALAEEEVQQLLTRSGLDAGLRPREVDRTIASGLKDSARRPRSVAA